MYVWRVVLNAEDVLLYENLLGAIESTHLFMVFLFVSAPFTLLMLLGVE